MLPMANPGVTAAGRGRFGALQLGRVLVVADDPDARDTIIAYFVDHQCIAIGAKPADLARQLQHSAFSLVVLDLRRGLFDGFDTLHAIRARSDVPLIVVVGRHQDEIDRVLALELGADDIFREPLNPRELLARARAILRRQEVGRYSSGGSAARIRYRFDGWELDRSTRILINPAGESVSLSKNEFALLLALLESPRRPLSRPQLMQATGTHEDAYDRCIDVQMLRLRKKIEADPARPRLIKTERGVGYVLNATVQSLF